MEPKSKIDELLSQLIDRWLDWDNHEGYYLNELAPRIVKDPGYGDEREKELHEEIRRELTESEWLQLPALIREKRAEKLRETQKQQLRRQARESAKREEQQRLAEERRAREEEKLRLECQKREERLKESQREKLFEELRRKMMSDYLHSDDFFHSSCCPLISFEEYEDTKSSFLQKWSQMNIKTELDREQALAVASIDRHVQVVARAGSGKTTTISVRAAFLQKHCGVKPEELLLLAFNRKAAQEMKDRLGTLLKGRLPHVMTFHALAYAIVHPDESPLFDDPEGSQSKSRALQTIIDHHLNHPDYRDQIRMLMLSHFREDWERIIRGGFERDKKDFLRYRRSLPRESLRGEHLKSFGEKVIADFLFEHDIPYKYERNFWWNGVNYRPDFTVFLGQDVGIIIEYFGLAGDPDYDAMSNKKRLFWNRKPGWTLLEFTPEDIRFAGKGGFLEMLKKSLQDRSVECNPLSEDEIWHRLKDRAIDRFTKAVVSFVQRCRKLSLKSEHLASIVRTHVPASDAERQFLDVVLPIYDAYLNRIMATGEDDFDGLMQRAAQAVSSGETKFVRRSGKGDLKEIKYICIDEHQDFSELFHHLMQAIRGQNPSLQFFCVGDDWQAINGFAGSDLRFYENFQKDFNPSRHLYISTNYRSCTSIVEASNRLMQGLGKPAVADKKEAGSVMLADLGTFKPTTREVERHSGDNLTPAVLRLAGSLLASGKEILLLSRRNRLPWYVNFDEKHFDSTNWLHGFLDLLKSFLPKELWSNIDLSTTHKAKGLQRSTVIVLDAVDRSYPLIHPDWIFSRFLGDTVEKIIDEEKRLFYVALSRAADKLIVLTEQGSFSPFLMALQERPLSYVNWSKLPPLKEFSARVTVKIGNQEGHGFAPTFNIKDHLKAEGYRWVSTEWQSWCRTYDADLFSVQNLLESSTWMRHADGIEMRVHDDHNILVGRYRINNGQYHSLLNKLR